MQEESQVDVTVTVRNIREDLADSCGPGSESGERTPDIPKSNWVNKAFQAFVRLGWAKRQKGNAYIYCVRKRRKPLEQFYIFCAKEKCKTVEEREKRRAKEIEKLPLFKHLIEHEKN